jgi:hypothetical protein
MWPLSRWRLKQHPRYIWHTGGSDSATSSVFIQNIVKLAKNSLQTVYATGTISSSFKNGKIKTK